MKDINKFDLLDWYLRGIKKSFTIEGRATHREFWSFFLIYILAYVITITLDVLMGNDLSYLYSDTLTYVLSFPLSFSWSFSAIYLTIFLIPITTLYIRRLHDIGFNAGWIFTPYLFYGISVILMWRTGLLTWYEEGYLVVDFLESFGIIYSANPQTATIVDIIIFFISLFIALVVNIALFIFPFLRGEPRDNEYGLDTTKSSKAPPRHDPLYMRMR